jgi:hypothetical protein
VDIGRAFKAIFEDPSWPVKLLLAFVFEVLVVTGPAVVGYFLQYMRNVAEGHDVPLPEWNAFGTYWVHGLLVILAAIVYVFVGLLLFIIGVIPAVILLQAAVVEYAMTWRGGSLFALRTVWRRVAAHTEFWTAWLIALAMGVVSSAITSPLTSAHNSAVNGLGGLIGAAIGLYTLAVSQHLYGQYARFAYGYAAPTRPQQPAPGGYVPPASQGPHPTA